MRIKDFVSTLFLGMTLSLGTASAKGLNELAEDKPADAEAAAEPATPAQPKPSEAQPKTTGATKEVTPALFVQSATSKALANNLFVESGFGWASARRKEGKWKGSGMSDITAGYRLSAQLMPQLALWGTYRYAPIGVAGELDGVSYRGIWEGHNFGALGVYNLSDKLNLLGSFELAYVLVYLRPLDNIKAEKKAETNGVMANIGGGANWNLLEKFSAGPRLHIGVGSFTVVQVSGAATYSF